jgi:hypothetical protein
MLQAPSGGLGRGHELFRGRLQTSDLLPQKWPRGVKVHTGRIPREAERAGNRWR